MIQKLSSSTKPDQSEDTEKVINAQDIGTQDLGHHPSEKSRDSKQLEYYLY
jgi:hypothetical protein